MRAIAVCQPWASAAVFGKAEVINSTRRVDWRGPALVCAVGVDRRAARYAGADAPIVGPLDNPYLDVRDAAVGFVSVTGCYEPGECQLRFAAGPWVLTLADPLVLDEPEPCVRFTGVAKAAAGWGPVMRRCRGPKRWMRDYQDRINRALTERDVYGPRRADGWVGD